MIYKPKKKKKTNKQTKLELENFKASSKHKKASKSQKLQLNCDTSILAMC